MADPKFVVTDTGLAVASVATPTGPFIEIVGFRIGSAYGYEPQRTDTGLNGTLLYTGQVLDYENMGDGVINIICRIDAGAGPFDFGEVCLDLAGPVMFAKAVFDVPQKKYPSLGTNVQSTYTFNCLIKLEQSTAVFKIETFGSPPDVWAVDKWSDVYPPALSANPGIPLILVRELDHQGNSTLLSQADAQYWTVGTNYKAYGLPRTVVSGTPTSIQIAKSAFSGVLSGAPSKIFVVRYGVAFRAVSSVVDAGNNWQFNLSPDPLAAAPTAGSSVQLFYAGPASFAALVDVPRTSKSIFGIGALGNGMNDNEQGLISTNGLLHNAMNSGRFLKSTDTLDYITAGQPSAGGHWPSGLYTVAFDNKVQGGPAGIGAVSAVVEIVNTLADVPGTLGVVNQTWYPSAANSANLPGYFRSLLDASNNLWTPWRRLMIAPASSAVLEKVSIANPRNYTVPADRIGYYTTIRYEPASGSDITNAQLVLNGVQVCVMNVPPDNTSSMYSLQLNPGDNVQITGSIGTIGLNTTSYIMLYPVGITSWN